MNTYTSYLSGFVFCAAVLAATPALSEASVLALDFSGGNGTSLVDQYTGIAGDGWLGGWTLGGGSQTSNRVATVKSDAPLYAGGGNYLSVSYSSGTSSTLGDKSVWLSRRWDTNALSQALDVPFTLSFSFRTNTDTYSANQGIVIFASNSATAFTGADSWRIGASGLGWQVYDKSTNQMISLGTGVIDANETWRISVTVLASAGTYSVAAYKDTAPDMVYQSATLDLRNSGLENLSYLNFVSHGGDNKNDLGFSIGNVRITQVPESGTSALLLGVGVVAGIALLQRKRRKS